jgi:hypothetical protein
MSDQMVKISYGDDQIDAYMVEPDIEPKGGLLVIHEIGV